MRTAATWLAILTLGVVGVGCGAPGANNTSHPATSGVSDDLGSVRAQVEREVAASHGGYVVSTEDTAHRILVRYDDSAKDSVSDLKRRLSAYGDTVVFQHFPGELQAQ